jgi:DNA polymerase/3'-5' exonuclease PolX
MERYCRDIDLIARSDEPEKAIEVFTVMDNVQEVLKREIQGSIIYKGNIQVDLRSRKITHSVHCFSISQARRNIM